MWLKRLLEWNEKELKKDELERLNFKYELHTAKYIVEILKDTIDFKIKKEKLVIIKDKKEITIDEFIYWWQIIRYQEISKEQIEIKTKIKDINEKMLKISKMLPSEEDDEETKKKKEKKKEELEKKREKLIQFMKKDEPNVKKNLTLLNNFKTSFIQIESIKRLLNHIENYIMFE